MPRSITEIKQEINDLEKEILRIKTTETVNRLDVVNKALQEQEAEKRYRNAADLYARFKQAEAAVDAYRSDIEKTGRLASDPLGVDFRVKLLSNGRTAVTFHHINPGAVIDLAGVPHLAKSVDCSPLGNRLELLPLTAKLYVGDSQQPVAGHLDYSQNSVTLPKSVAVSPGDIFTIGSVRYVPKYLVGSTTVAKTFELEPVNE